MAIRDDQGYDLSGTDWVSEQFYSEALLRWQTWRDDPLPPLSRALAQSPGFAMGWLLHSYVHLCGRELRHVQVARRNLEVLAGLPLNEREAMHYAVMRALVSGSHERAMGVLTQLLARFPRDIVALQVAHAMDYLLGNERLVLERVQRQLAHWAPEVPGYDVVCAMLAFGQAENGVHEEALEWCLRATAGGLALPRLHHVMAHVCEMSGRHEFGRGWMRLHQQNWSVAGPSTVHCWWHLALFELHCGDRLAALEIHDRVMGDGTGASLTQLIDSSSLLWRMHLTEMPLGERWSELANRWQPHLDDGYCAFSDVHAMLTLVAAEQWGHAAALLRFQRLRAPDQDNYGVQTRTVGLPVCEALLAFGQGRYEEAADGLSALSPVAMRLGGSRAQCSVIALTQLAAMRRSGASATIA